MPENTYDFETMKQVQLLESTLGGRAECRRLGFVHEDESGVAALTAVGLGYLIYVRGRGITNVAEAFAAGFECGFENGE